MTRIVFIFKSFVIKVPKPANHLHFLQGCYANWSERHLCKMFKNVTDPNLYSLVAPSYFCSWFGLFQIQARCIPLDRKLYKQEMKRFSNICTDIKFDNFGYYKNRLVCLDYA